MRLFRRIADQADFLRPADVAFAGEKRADFEIDLLARLKKQAGKTEGTP